MKVIATILALSLTSHAFLEAQEKISLSNPFVEKIHKTKPPTIKVLIGEEMEGTLIEVKGSYVVTDPFYGMEIASGMLGKRFFLFPYANGIKWGEDFLGIFQIRIAPTDPETAIFVDGIQYRGCIEIYNTNNRINVINEVDIENYLKSTLTLQFENAYDDEVMNAVSVAARTNAFFTALRNKESLWHVKAKEVGYEGYGLTLQNLDLERAIEATRSLVMTFEGEPFATALTANSAGRTAHYQTIFRKNVNTPNPVKSHYALRDREASHWSFVLDRSMLAEIAATSRVTGVELYVDQESGKSYALRVRDGIGFKDIDFFALQKAIGPQKLLSNDFTIELKNDKVVFNGYGEGCGVGLCLYSAKVMAQHGENAPKILSAFFPGAHLQKMRSIEEPEVIAEAELPPNNKGFRK